ncbi:MAG: tRNA uridine(34) 5-carboxymethylaminomethyl modification radical SAM/GNAT enzyme Elp3 [Candidatus Aenigmarchaeota archaeon]|nr:tRNA uridine(34) 5-carboxymethylaminomethyl modification radical SAM/GNAT enzyme Elp3 [Candidatus Aenigmarchaeota archaeon]
MPSKEKSFALEIIDAIRCGKIKTPRELTFWKRKMSKKYGVLGIVPNSEILKYADKRKGLEVLIKKPVRTISGVCIVAVMAKPHPCPGKCIYCPEGDDSPKSYTGLEPAARRAKMFNYDPYLQAKNRLEQLHAIGHPIEKAELIIMGGTFPAQDTEYQKEFVKRCLDAMNQTESKTLEGAQKLNETTKTRCVGLTIETRPDFCKKEHINAMLALGTTRVEIGVQTLSDTIYKKMERGHSIKDVIEATQLLKDSGIKVCYHMMPGLLQDEKEDLKMFRELFNNPDFRPDMLKIYPTLVTEGTGIYKLWKEGKYTPYDNERAAKLVAEIKKILPPYVRLMRVQRDIPKEKIAAGVTAGNLRELAEKILLKEGSKCRCIRCREAGHMRYKKGVVPEKVEITELEYKSSEGTEYFISAEDIEKDVLVGYLRLRIPAKPFRPEIDAKTALVRELKVSGTSTPLGEKGDAFQHKGLGKKLMERAEKIAGERAMKKIVVTSAIGTREYYRKFGYERTGVYVGKSVNK